MSRWIAEKNIEDFREKIASEVDPERRRILTELLAKELAKLERLDQQKR